MLRNFTQVRGCSKLCHSKITDFIPPALYWWALPTGEIITYVPGGGYFRGRGGKFRGGGLNFFVKIWGLKFYALYCIEYGFWWNLGGSFEGRGGAKLCSEKIGGGNFPTLKYPRQMNNDLSLNWFYQHDLQVLLIDCKVIFKSNDDLTIRLTLQ